MTGTFDAMVDSHRCTAVLEDGRRCQLLAGHDEGRIDRFPACDHAYTPKRAERARERPGWARWDATGVARVQPAGSERLPWACMGHD